MNNEYNIFLQIIVDPVTRQSKGYGFVKFSNYEESQSAIREMAGSLLRGRAIKTNQAHIKNAGTESSGLSSANLMLNPLLASISAANPLQMSSLLASSAGGLALGGYGGQVLPNAQAYQTNLYGMPGYGYMQTMQPDQTMATNSGFTYSNRQGTPVQAQQSILI